GMLFRLPGAVSGAFGGPHKCMEGHPRPSLNFPASTRLCVHFDRPRVHSDRRKPTRMRHPRLLLGFLLVSLLGTNSARAGMSKEVLKDILLHEQSRSGDDGVLAKYAADKDAEVRARALRALGRLQDVKLLPVMAQGLSDKQEAVRLEAAFDVGQLF